MGSIMGAWQLVYIGAAIPCGLLLDKVHARSSLLLGALLIALSALGRSYATDYWTLLLAVMLFGIGGPIISAGAPKVITQWFHGSDRGLAMGIYMTGPALGSVVALTLTHSLLLPMFDQQWRSVLQLWAAFTLAGGLIWWFLASRPAVLGFERQQLQQQRELATTATPTPITDLLALPAVRLVMFMSVGVFLINHGLTNWLPEILYTSGMDRVQAGYWAAVPTLVGILGSLTIPRLATPERRFQILIGLCLAAIVACLLLQYTDPARLSIGLLLQGLARSSMMTVLILTLVEWPGIGDSRAGAASGLFFSAAEVGGMLGPLGLGIIYDLSAGFNAGLYFLAATAALLTLGSSRLKRMSTQTDAH